MTTPVSGSTLSAASVTFTWSTGTGNLEYWLSVYSPFVAAQANAIYSQSAGMNPGATVAVLPTDGSTVLVRLWWRTGATWASGGHADYTYTAASSGGAVPPAPPQ